MIYSGMEFITVFVYTFHMDRLLGMQVFLRVVETGSFSKAAAELGMTQPTATKAVAEAEKRLGVRLLHRTTRSVTATEIGLHYYDRCKSVVRSAEEADSVATQADIAGTLRVATSVAFGRRVMVPLVLRYMDMHPKLRIDLSVEDRYVNLVEQGLDLAIRMGRLADSTLGANHLGYNPWVLVASAAYLRDAGHPKTPADLAKHRCLIYSSVQGDARWLFFGPSGEEQSVPVDGPFRSNNLSAVLAACDAGMGLAVLPWYVARDAVARASVVPVLTDYRLPAQEMHAVFPSPKLVPPKVTAFIAWLQDELSSNWWERKLS